MKTFRTKPQFNCILALMATIAACGHSGQDLSLEQTESALACKAAGRTDCVPANDTLSQPDAPSAADAGAQAPYAPRCDSDADCEYGEVCEHRHGPNRCEPAGYADEYADDDSEHDSDDDHGHHRGVGHPEDGYAADAGAPACDDDGSAHDDRCGTQPDSDYAHDDHGGEDRGGSNSGRH